MIHIIFIILAYMGSICAIDIGSDTSPSRFSANQILEDGDRIAGFASVEGGFALASMSTEATFDSVFPVSGDLDLAGGTLLLDQDLLFNELSGFFSLGFIQGSNHTLELARSMTCVPYGIAIDFADCMISLVDSEALPADVNSVAWSYDDQYVAIGMDTGGGNEVRVFSFDGTSLTSLDTVSVSDTVYSVDWHPSEHYLAVGRDAIGGPELLIYSFNGTTLTLIDSDELGADVAAVAYHSSGDYLIIGTDSVSQEIVIYNVNANGTLGSDVSVNIPTPLLGSSPEIEDDAVSWSADGDYVAFGTNQTGGLGSYDELRVYELGVSPLSLTLNASIDFSTEVRAVAFNPRYSNILAVGLNGSSPRLRIYQHNPGAGTLTQIITVSTNLGQSIRNLHWRRGGHCLALTKDAGAGNELQIYEYDHDAVTLSSVDGVNFASTARGTKWSHNGHYLALGTDTNVLNIYQSITLLADMCYTFSDLCLQLNCNTKLQDCCIKFGGDCVINGRGMILDIEPTCTLYVDSNASLLFKDVIVRGVSGNQLDGIDATSTYSFQDVQLLLDGNYSFTIGKFDIIKDLEIIGKDAIFAYQTDQVSTISTNGKLILDTGVTFSYDPSAASSTLLQMTDASSQICLNSATLHTTSTSLQLTKGRLIVDGQSIFASESSTPGAGIIFGDGTNASNNVCVEVLPAANVIVSQGIVENKNV